MRTRRNAAGTPKAATSKSATRRTPPSRKFPAEPATIAPEPAADPVTAPATVSAAKRRKHSADEESAGGAAEPASGPNIDVSRRDEEVAPLSQAQELPVEAAVEKQQEEKAWPIDEAGEGASDAAVVKNPVSAEEADEMMALGSTMEEGSAQEEVFEDKGVHGGINERTELKAGTELLRDVVLDAEEIKEPEVGEGECKVVEEFADLHKIKEPDVGEEGKGIEESRNIQEIEEPQVGDGVEKVVEEFTDVHEIKEPGVGGEEAVEEFGNIQEMEEPGIGDGVGKVVEEFQIPGVMKESKAGEEDDMAEGVADGNEVEEAPKIDMEEEFEMSKMAQNRKMKKEREIFICGLGRDVVEEDIKKAFEQFGEVMDVCLHKDFMTNKNKGYAFVTFATKEQTDHVLLEMKHPVIRGKCCDVAPSEENDTLFLGNICNTWTKEAIKEKLQGYGIDGVENITLLPDTQNEGLSRGFAFLEFTCHGNAVLAYKRLQKPDAIFGHPERSAKVAFAEPIREPDPQVMAQVKSVFVDGLPPYWDEDRVRQQFGKFGEIERVVLARNMSSSKRNDFGFVNFSSHESAIACIEGISGVELGDDGKTKIKTKASLANPLPKTQAVKGGMSGGYRIGHTGHGSNAFGGRGIFRGRSFRQRGYFHGQRGSNFSAQGRGGRFPLTNDRFQGPPAGFPGRRPFGFQGGRWTPQSGRRGSFDGGRGRGFPPRGPPIHSEWNSGSQFAPNYLGEDPYFYGRDPYFHGDAGHGRGVKRPFSMMEHDYDNYPPMPRPPPRVVYPDQPYAENIYREPFPPSSAYPSNYFGPGYDPSMYPPRYSGEHSGRGHYF